jgi:predicted O-methyltransferase YrrM
MEIQLPLPEPFRSALLSMHRNEPQLGSDGQLHCMDGRTAIGPEQGLWLYSLCREMKPQSTLEIGLAYGFSTLYFLTAIHENGTGHHIALDPFQNKLWSGVGLSHAQSLGMTDSFGFIEEESASVLVHLAKQGRTFEIIFIDGSHRFDDVLMDFRLSAPLCSTGGCIVLDDMWMPSIRRAVSFIRSNRKDFVELKTGLSNIAAFRRIGDDARPWNHYEQFFFETHSLSWLTVAAVRAMTPRILRRAINRSLRVALRNRK